MAALEDEDVDICHVTVRDFHHPYTPYTIQETFMETVYQVLEDGKGKSLSLICGAITWLRDHKRRSFETGLDWCQGELTDEPQWIVEKAKASRRREMLRQREELEARLAKIKTKEKAQRLQYLNGGQTTKKRKTDSDKPERLDEEQFVLEDYYSDDEIATVISNKAPTSYSAETLALLAKVGMAPSIEEEDEAEIRDETKIFYCSRTHSQLTQFINELRRPRFPTSMQDEVDAEPVIEDLKHLTLGSRKNLCINPKVAKLGSLTAINERCSELQRSGTAQDHKCVFLPNKDNQPLVNSYRDHALATIRDIEDMGALGKGIGICPYYASRAAIKPAEIVTLPYPLLLQKSAREALGINLKGHVVIIDEAHNLMDAISGIHGVEISLKQLQLSRRQLGVYLQKFRNRLKGKNRVYIAQIVRVVDSLSGYLEKMLVTSKTDDIVSENELLTGKGIDQINLFKLLHYLRESKLARKVESYATFTNASSLSDTPNIAKPESSSPVLHTLASLLSALTHPSAEGRLFFSRTGSDGIVIRFMLLDPSTHFREIVSSARAVILAGGTMSPFADYTSHLFPYLPPTSIRTLSCGHVIPSSNLLAWNLSRGGAGNEFEFTFKNRSNSDMVDELGRVLLNICSVVPDGVVVFFPSYSYLSTIISRWEAILPGSNLSILRRLEAKKALFREDKDASVESVLQNYARAIDTGKGGLLLSVVGGKMSEGINFSDSLGRCVVIVGLPFPNIQSAEWKAKIEYIESATVTRLTAGSATGGGLTKDEIMRRAKEEGREFYENACMRAVNQSVGRAIRHRGDYAAIVMIDKRYGNERIKGKLPQWIRGGLVEGAGDKTFGALMGGLSTFFRGKRRA